jgi:ethanolamine ammonia-lyase small subunit
MDDADMGNADMGNADMDNADMDNADMDNADMDDAGRVVLNPWQALRRFTPARIALGRSGVSQPTAAQLAFQLAHAGARDAVHQALDAPALAAALGQAGFACQMLHSACPDRPTYLQRPDLGRRLDASSRHMLERAAPRPGALALVIVDGLSALAIEQHALPLLEALRARLATDDWPLAPLALVEQGRVAVGDEIGELLRACAVVVLIGERPGLSSPDSMGIYMTWAPQRGLTDASRNCISNVREAGLSHAAAAAKLHYLLTRARACGISGVGLKDDSSAPAKGEIV